MGKTGCPTETLTVFFFSLQPSDAEFRIFLKNKSNTQRLKEAQESAINDKQFFQK